ncbi:MAG: IS982 family transposase, partial [Enterovibrio sp.]
MELFCDVDDFCAVFMPEWEKTLLADGTRKRQRAGRMTISEVMTIIVL